MERKAFGDREMMQDALSSQKQVAAAYDSFANECSSPAVMSELMNILNEEHQLQHEVFDELQKRGWYTTEPAPQKKIDECREQFTPK